MHIKGTVKTALARRLNRPLFVVLFALLATYGGLAINNHHHDTLPTEPLSISGQTYIVEIASSQIEQDKGLGGRVSMQSDRGMIFATGESKECFWMKDMRFSLDIIWVGLNHKISHIESNLSPSTYPKIYCAVGAYVIELNSGQANAHEMRAGQDVRF
jgi:uncharacterized membrane protein (UPF0127 family)